MPKTQRQTELKEQLDNSRGVKMLLPSYQKALYELVDSDDTSQQSAIGIMLKREKPSDIQSVYFTEAILEKFIETNFPPQDQEALLEEYKEKTKHLIRAFLFMNTEEKNEILPKIDLLNIQGCKELIALYKMGHHKQSEYLQIFAEKDPKTAIKFNILVHGGVSKTLKQKTKSNKNRR